MSSEYDLRAECAPLREREADADFGGSPAGVRSNFFFQAEDGIRDLTVTGVQTCALPIFSKKKSLMKCQNIIYKLVKLFWMSSWLTRSEERRVGKECRSRWLVYL